MHSYGKRLSNAHGGGHEFSLTVTLAGEQKFDLILDTGSPITYLPCVGCPVELCGFHEHPYYDWRMSNDFRVLNVSTNTADAAFCDIMPVGMKNISDSGSCIFLIGYMDGAAGAGWMVEDIVSVGGELSHAKMVFGCGGLTDADGGYDRQDGMAGFSRGPTAFHTQLVKAGVIDAHVFGFCSEGSSSDSAMLSLGRYDFGRDLAPLSYTNMLPGDTFDFFSVRTRSWKLGETTIAGSSNVVTVLDSGTTMVVLPSVMFLDFINQLKAQITRTHPEILVIEDKNITGSYCLIPETTVLTGKLRQEWFPKLTITYDLDIRLNLPAENYLYSHPVIPHVFCVGVEESEDGNITLGQQTLRNTFLEFDIENNRVGMVVAQCEQLRKKFAPDDPHNPWRLVAIVFILLFTACIIGGVSFFLYIKFGSRKLFRYQVFDDEPLDQEVEMNGVLPTSSR